MAREEGTGLMWSVCGQRIRTTSQAIVHAAECCSVGRECTKPKGKCKHPGHRDG